MTARVSITLPWPDRVESVSGGFVTVEMEGTG